MLIASDERYFERPLEFIPERWTTERELTKNSSVSIPFLIGTISSQKPLRNTKTFTGPYSCVGKQLALMELRYVVAQVVHRYDVELAAGESRKRFEDGMRDDFTLSLGPLNMVFSHRK
jgi:cytochrome P450